MTAVVEVEELEFGIANYNKCNSSRSGSILDPEAILFLGSTLFLWQFSHFFALNWMYRTDYKRGGFSMVAVNDPNGDRTASLIKRYRLYLASLPILSTALEVTSPMFAVEGILLNGYALHVASKFDKERSNGNARKVFLTSLWYLPCVMMLFLSTRDVGTRRSRLLPMMKRKRITIAIGGIYWIPSRH